MNHRKSFLAAAMAAGLLVALALPAAAQDPYLAAFNSRYGTTGSRIDTCNLCHTSPNQFYDAFNARPHTGSNTATALAAIEGLDSDGDGFTNKVEIDARFFPGNAADHPPVGPAVTVLSPNGQEVIPSGSVWPVTWQAQSNAVTFTVAYSLDGGATWKTAATGLTGTAYSWTAPTPVKNKAKGLVKVTAYDVSSQELGSDTSDAGFAVQVVAITAPAAGDILAGGSTAGITWIINQTVRPVNSISLLYTTNGGTTWKNVATLAGGSTDFAWGVPSIKVNRARCRVKIILKDSLGKAVGSALSAGLFTIQP